MRGTDNTLVDSRDALGPLLVSLQEVRFGLDEMREIYKGCETNRRALRDMLIERGTQVETPPASLDIIVRPRCLPKLSLRRKWGLVTLKDGKVLVTAQPSVTSRHIENLVKLFSTGVVREGAWLQQRPTGAPKYLLSFAKLEFLLQRVAGWRVLARLSSGYSLN